ncbi:S-adenosyl-L-methionine-dependent methyltransferase [Leptodontidium sp. MPI-SDFR-AT-0119]|nr:S-adenosyl-L-methionine-dependent methyltransferase [Leptodontidium sp. MPI-SDFR-AT-0119]
MAPSSQTINEGTRQGHDIVSLYNSIGQRYENVYKYIPAQQASLEWLVFQLPHPGSYILDVGCGTGSPVASTLSAPPNHHTVHGIDVSEGMLSVAKSSVPSATFQLIDCRDYSAAPATFDADMISNIFVWLKPGGLLVFSTIPADVEHFEQTWLGRKGIFSSLSEAQYNTLLSDLGFIVEYVKVENFMPKVVEAGLCNSKEVMEEPQLFIYARKPY